MDDFNVTSLHESKNEWGARLLTILTPLIIEGFQSIYEESYSLCQSNNETEKHLMTFQNFISRIPKWNSNIVEEEQKRISEKSGCSYLEDLITCVHIIQLKLLTAVRVGSKQKKIDIKIPNINDFIHKVYINSARKIYKNVYLFERNVPPLQVQKHGRELEILIQESILNSVRESIPVDLLLRSYLDETTEEDVNVEIQEEEISVPSETPQTSPPTLSGGSPVKKSLTFSEQPSMSEPQPIKTLETISNNIQTEQLQLENEQNDSQSSEKLKISDLNGNLTHEDVHSLDPPSIEVIPDLMIDDIEILP
tara:strand:+ start:11247 stop:12170 length:924 start_codon:yes stop_codon:yes gene_type:complete